MSFRPISDVSTVTRPSIRKHPTRPASLHGRGLDREKTHVSDEVTQISHSLTSPPDLKIKTRKVVDSRAELEPVDEARHTEGSVRHELRDEGSILSLVERDVTGTRAQRIELRSAEVRRPF